MHCDTTRNGPFKKYTGTRKKESFDHKKKTQQITTSLKITN